MYRPTLRPPVARIVSVNVGQVTSVRWEGRRIPTGFLKRPMTGPATVGPLGVEGDSQADLRVHGGPRKAVYAYPSEHYAYWRRELPDVAFDPGSFGENLTTEGWLEAAVRPGDRFGVGSAELEVTTPRLPCFKMDARFHRSDMMVRFARSLRTGFYLAVVTPGTIRSGDAVRPTRVSSVGPTVADVAGTRLGAAGTDEDPDGRPGRTPP